MSLECPEKIKGESARVYVTRMLKQNIINLNLKPGDLISENEISELLNISRTPVREAFIRLSQDQLIEIFPQRGTYVSKINLDNVEEGRFVRYNLEMAIVKLACEKYATEALIKELEQNIHMQEYLIQEYNNGTKNFYKIMQLDEEFHRIIYRHCKKERTSVTIESLNYDFYRIRTLSISSSLKLERVYHQHNLIKDALKERNPVSAQAAVDAHLTSVYFDQEELLKEYPDYFVR